MALDRDQILSKAEEYFEQAPDKPRYQEEESNQLERLPIVFEEGTWDWDDLVWIIRWKSARVIRKFERNDPEEVDKVIAEVVDSSSTEQKLDLLTNIIGVRVKVGSAFLLFMNPEQYTVIDSRAGGFLSQEGYIPPLSDSPSIEEYINYLDVCRGLADDYNVDLRNLDRAIWVLGE